jgi:hypothetical protein
MRCGVNEIGMTPDQFSKGGFRAMFGVLAEQLSIGF